MENQFKLHELLKEYKIQNLNNFENVVLNKHKYSRIREMLEYLINELGIDPQNIVKSRSCIKFNIGQVKKNYDFLVSNGIKKSNIETCLHVLGSNHEKLLKTYNFVLKNFGIEVINIKTSILGVNVSRIKDIIDLKIFKENSKENLTIAVGGYSIDAIRKIIVSEEFKNNRELFTPQVLAHSNIEKIQEIIRSEEFKNNRELFTATTLAYSNIEKIQEIIRSEEFKNNRKLFTSEVLAHSNIEKIQQIIRSEKFKNNRELFTSQVLAQSNIEDIKKFLNMDVWDDEKYKKLLTPSIVAKSKKMMTKIPILIEMAEKYGIDKYININFLLKSPSENYALINYIKDNGLELINKNGKLNSCFSYQSSALLKRHNIDLKKISEIYKFEEDNDLSMETEGMEIE